MLRIETQQGPTTTSFIIEGKLTGPWVNELEKCWQTATTVAPSRSIVINLVAVAYIDSQGRDLLIRMRRQGAEIVPSGCLMKAIVAEIEDTIRAAERS